MANREIDIADWRAEAKAKFGDDPLDWRFVCPVCKYEAANREWVEASASESAAFSCVGRYRKSARRAFGGTGPGPCDYAGGGLFVLNPVRVRQPDGTVIDAFEFGTPTREMPTTEEAVHG